MLNGIRVIEFTHVWAGPLCGQFLADLGAEVIKIESATHLDVHRRAGPYAPDTPPSIDTSGVWNAQNRNKRSCRVNLSHPAGIALAKDVIGLADIVIENFRPGTLDRLGLGYDALSVENSRLVMVSITGYGQGGPWSKFPAYGPMMDAVGGLSWATRDSAGRPASVNGWFPDVSGAAYGAVAAVAGFLEAERTGRGVHFDISELETTIALEADALGPSVEDESVQGNADADAVAIWVLPTNGTDQWISIRLASFDEASRLCAALDIPADVRGDDDLVAAEAKARAILADRDVADVCAHLQANGVEAVPVMSSRDLWEDEHLRARGSFVDVDQGPAGTFRTYAPIYRSPGAPVTTLAAPALGESDSYVFGELLGMSAERIQELGRDGVIQ